MRFRLMVLALALLPVAACKTIVPGIPGYVSTHKSDFDGRVEVRMEPAWVNGAPLKIGLFWHSALAPDEFILDAIMTGHVTFRTVDPVLLKIDDEVVQLATNDPITRRSVHRYSQGLEVRSTLRFHVQRSLIERMIAAKRVLIRANLETEYIEREFSNYGGISVLPASRDFLLEVAEAQKLAHEWKPKK